ncbi:hypothetical protein [Aquabacterium sp.]|nr:hypothetical protein [Aquabacterium sp.]HSW07343.1 hypothetical protein [Aquabacterium sp.]
MGGIVVRAGFSAVSVGRRPAGALASIAAAEDSSFTINIAASMF